MATEKTLDCIRERCPEVAPDEWNFAIEQGNDEKRLI